MGTAFSPASGSSVHLAQSADFEIGGLKVYPARRQIRFKEETRTLEPRVMQVLVALYNARRKVVSRDELALACWGGVSVGDDAINRCIVALRRYAREFQPTPFKIETIPRVGYSLREAHQLPKVDARLLPAALVAGLVLLLLLSVWRPWQRNASPMSVAVAPASNSAASNALARDLAAKLAMLDDEAQTRLRLLDRPGSEKPDLLFEVDAFADRQDFGANLVLLNKRHEVVWSEAFRRPRSDLADLKQQIAFSAGKLVECTLETDLARPKLDRSTVKLYLNGCAKFSDLSEENLSDLHAIFSQVASNAPAFQPARAKLLLVDAENALIPRLESDQSTLDKALLQKSLAAARKRFPDMPEVYLAEAALVKPTGFAERMRLLQEAVSKDPDNAAVTSTLAANLMNVGRLRDAVREAKRAVRLDPLSPNARQMLISAYATAGKLSQAEEQLDQADRLWPGAATLRDVRYFLSLRFAAPADAIRLRDAGTVNLGATPIHGSFLEARANPTEANVQRALRDARSFYANDRRAIFHLAQTLGEFGKDEELFDILLSWRDAEYSKFVVSVIFRPALHSFRRDPRMIQVSARLGLLDYWQSSGNWPDFCFEPDLPYDCKKEAGAVIVQ